MLTPAHIFRLVATVAAKEAFKEGYLLKKSPNEKLGIKFQKRWIIVRGNSITYYKNDTVRRIFTSSQTFLSRSLLCKSIYPTCSIFFSTFDKLVASLLQLVVPSLVIGRVLLPLIRRISASSTNSIQGRQNETARNALHRPDQSLSYPRRRRQKTIRRSERLRGAFWYADSRKER